MSDLYQMSGYGFGLWLYKVRTLSAWCAKRIFSAVLACCSLEYNDGELIKKLQSARFSREKKCSDEWTLQCKRGKCRGLCYVHRVDNKGAVEGGSAVLWAIVNQLYIIGFSPPPPQVWRFSNGPCAVKVCCTSWRRKRFSPSKHR
jgi:hypothetical protein